MPTLTGGSGGRFAGSQRPTGASPFQRTMLLAGLAAVLGLAGGGAAWLLLHLIGFLTNAALLSELAWTEPPSLADFEPGLRLVVVAAGGGLVVALLARWSPTIRGHGIPESMQAVLHNNSRIPPRAALAKPTGSAVAIGTGAPFGSEGPIIVAGGALGSLVGQVVSVSARERKLLLASGAAAGMAATFGAPLASMLLAIELLLFEFSLRAFVPLAVAASVAAAMHDSLFGDLAFFTVPAFDFPGLGSLPLYALLGVACGLMAALITKGLSLTEAGYARLPLPRVAHPVIGAVGFALVGLAIPRVLGVGYEVISDSLLLGELSVGVLAAVCGGKLVAWWIALASDTSGSTVAPILLIAASFGALLAELAPQGFVPVNTAETFALVAMAAVFGAAVRAPFTSIVFLFELTRNFDVLLPIIVATVVADVVASMLLRESLMTEPLARRGLPVPGEYAVDRLGISPVSAIMTEQVWTLPVSATVAQASELIQREHDSYPVVDGDGAYVGVVDSSALAGASPETSVAALCHEQAPAAAPTESAREAVERMLDRGVHHLAVVDDGRVVGVLSTSDVLRAHRPRFAHEEREPGWARRFRPRSGSASEAAHRGEDPSGS